MRMALVVNRVLLVLLGVSTGAVKLAQMAEEMEILANAGIGTVPTMAFGAVQLVAALGVIPARTRRPAGVVLALTFVAATGVLFVNGLVAFGVFSLLFIAMAVVAAGPDSAPPD